MVSAATILHQTRPDLHRPPLSDTSVFLGVPVTFMLGDVVSLGYLCDVITFRFGNSGSAPLCALRRLSPPARQVAVVHLSAGSSRSRRRRCY